MNPDPTRRELLRALAYGAVALPSAGAVLAACTGSSSSSTESTALRSSTSSSTAPVNVHHHPSAKWWLRDGFAPVKNEATATKLAVEGSIPPQLQGLFVRNGSNPSSGDSTHWFFGDGMLHGVRLEGGKAQWYRNRYVETPLYTNHTSFASGTPGGTTTQSNVSVVWHGGKLLSSGEVGYPYEIDPTDLRTVGVHDFAGKLTTNFTAHPKIDPATGNLHFFGYGFTEPYLTYHVADASGKLVSSQPIAVKGPTMIHDFAITDRDVIFWELPVVFDLQSALQWLQHPESGAQPFVWRPSYGARIGTMPLGGPAAQMRWIEIDPCYVFHGVNAFRNGTDIVLDVCRMDSVFDPANEFIVNPSVNRWTIDTATQRVRDEPVDMEPGEFPQRDPRLVGRTHRYAYFTSTPYRDGRFSLAGLLKHDYRTGRTERWSTPDHVHAGEWLFVPDTSASGEDAGWLLTYLYDAASDSSALAIIDASDVRRGPVATVTLPQRVPYGFHATWVPKDE